MSPESTKLEAETREAIDAKIEAADWTIQDKNRLNMFESVSVAVRKMDTDTDTGPADYMLFLNGETYGIIKAKERIGVRRKTSDVRQIFALTPIIGNRILGYNVLKIFSKAA